VIKRSWGAAGWLETEGSGGTERVKRGDPLPLSEREGTEQMIEVAGTSPATTGERGQVLQPDRTTPKTSWALMLG